MNVNVKSVVKAVLILVILTVLPVIGQQMIPPEFFRSFTIQGGFDLMDFLNRIALTGVIMAVLVVLRGHVKKASAGYLALSAVWKVFWLFMVFFALGLGHPETLGLAALGGKAEAVENSVTFDFRLFAGLATAIVVLMIVRSVIMFQERK
ncbi:MAG: hypothetical protein QW231_01435 [Candidatus Bathyarchaeia archaeon]